MCECTWCKYACGGKYSSHQFGGTQRQERPWPSEGQEDDSTPDAREPFISLALGHWSRYCPLRSLSHQSSCAKQLVNGAIFKLQMWFMSLCPPWVTTKWSDIIATLHFLSCVIGLELFCIKSRQAGRRGLHAIDVCYGHDAWRGWGRMLILWFNCSSLSYELTSKEPINKPPLWSASQLLGSESPSTGSSFKIALLLLFILSLLPSNVIFQSNLYPRAHINKTVILKYIILTRLWQDYSQQNAQKPLRRH